VENLIYELLLEMNNKLDQIEESLIKVEENVHKIEASRIEFF